MAEERGTRQRPPRRHRRTQTSRQVRLRRTIAGAAVLLILGLLATKLLTRDQGVEAVDALPGVAASVNKPTTPMTPNSTPDSEDGSSVADTPSPSATPVPQLGNGKLSVVAVPKRTVASGGRTVRYTVEIEGGLGVDADRVASTIESVLTDPRGWQRVDGVRFVNVTPEEAAAGARVDIRVTLASPGLTDKLCAPMRTLSQVSCWNGERSVLNLRRWVLGDDSYGTDVARYRVYQVNHEVGHGLGHQHRGCPGKGQSAPVMMQQTLSLGACKPWPYPSRP